MKVFSLVAAMLAVTTFLFAQAPLYVLYDDACMNKLDYRYASGSSSLITSYAVSKNGGEQLLLLDVGMESSVSHAGVPKGTVRCNTLTDLRALASDINNKEKSVYVVRKRAQADYIITPVSSAGYVNQQGDIFEYAGFTYGFKLNAATSDFAENMSNRGGDKGFIFLKSRDMASCKRAFKFTYEPNSACACGEGSTFQFVAGLGFVSEENSICTTDVPKNGLQLVSVDGQTVNDAIARMCTGNQGVETPAMASAFTSDAPVTYNTAAKAAKISGEPVTETAWTSAGPVATEPEIVYVTTYPPTDVVTAKEPIGPPLPPVFCTAIATPGRHVVHKGETLYSISRRYNVPVKTLQAWNKLKNANQIKLCQTLIVADPKKESPTMATTAPAKSTVKKPAPTKTTAVVAKTAKPSKGTVKATKPAKRTTADAPATYSTTTKPPVPTTQKTALYNVSKGETFYSIGKTNGMTADQLAALNGMAPGTSLVAGQQIVILDPRAAQQASATATTYVSVNRAEDPTAPVIYSKVSTIKDVAPIHINTAGVVHIVAKGETLYGLAKKYGYSTERFALMNGLDANASLMVGQQLLITDYTSPIDRTMSTENLRVSTDAKSPATYSTPVTYSTPESVTTYRFSQPVAHDAYAANSGTYTSPRSTEYYNGQDEVQSTYTYEPETPATYSTKVEGGAAMGGHVSKDSVVEYYQSNPVKTHMITEGDTVAYLATKYKTTEANIRMWNGLEEHGVLVNGQTLIVQK